MIPSFSEELEVEVESVEKPKIYFSGKVYCRRELDMITAFFRGINQAISISADEISLKVSDRKNHEPLKVLMAGRSLYWKGFDFAIKAVGELIGEGKNIELHYYGSGPELDKLQKLANLIGGGQIVFHGNVKREELQKA